MTQTINHAHVGTSGLNLPEDAANPAIERQRNAAAIIQTAENLLANQTPQPGPYWPSNGSSDREDALSLTRLEGFEYNLIGKLGGSYAASKDEGILELDPEFRQKALLEAIAEIIQLAKLLLRDEVTADTFFVIENSYLVDDIKAACRKHLTRLLGRWYELEAAAGGAK